MRGQVFMDSAGGDKVYGWTAAFLFAGSSAFLLLLATAFPKCWPVSFIALTPFLFHVLKATPSEALRAGLLFGLSFAGAGFWNKLPSEPASFLLVLAIVTVALALFAWIVAIARVALGFRPLITAALWVMMELLMVKAGFEHGLLGQSQLSDRHLHGIGILLGFLMISFAIVYVNVCIALIIGESLVVVETHAILTCDDHDEWIQLPPVACAKDEFSLLPASRAPPTFGMVLRS